jgi:hypothetical protein
VTIGKVKKPPPVGRRLHSPDVVGCHGEDAS